MPTSPLREDPREQRASIIPVKPESSLLDWLQATGRLVSRDNQPVDYPLEDEDNVSELMESDDVRDFDYDDDEVLIDDEE